jgi:hypothetical protein
MSSPDAEHGNRSEEGARGAHYFAVDGRERAAETLVRTAVTASFTVRMGPPVGFGGTERLSRTRVTRPASRGTTIAVPEEVLVMPSVRPQALPSCGPAAGRRPSSGRARCSSSTGAASRSAARSRARSAYAAHPPGGAALGGARTAPDGERPPDVRPPARLPTAGRASLRGRLPAPPGHPLVLRFSATRPGAARVVRARGQQRAW